MSTSLTIVPRGSRRGGSQGGYRRSGNRSGNRRHNGGNRHHHSHNGVGGGGRNLSMFVVAAAEKQRKQQSRRPVPKSKPIELSNTFDALADSQRVRKHAKHNPVPKAIETPLRPQGAWSKVSPATLSTPAVQEKELVSVKAKFQLRFADSPAKQQDEQTLAKRLRAAEDRNKMLKGTIASLEMENRRLRTENADLQETATAAIDEVSKKGILKSGGIQFNTAAPETMEFHKIRPVSDLRTDAAAIRKKLADIASENGVKLKTPAEAAAAAVEHHRKLMAEQLAETALFAKSGSAGAWKPKRKRVAGGGGSAAAIPVPAAAAAAVNPFGDRSTEWGETSCEVDDSW